VHRFRRSRRVGGDGGEQRRRDERPDRKGSGRCFSSRARREDKPARARGSRTTATQARRFGAEVLAREAVSVGREDPYRIVRLADGTDISCYSVILATGVSVRTLKVPGMEALLGICVYYGAAMTEAAAYRGQDVCIVGAGIRAAWW
jgi:thioredoxin reductase